jgi:hypothetical protein
VPFVFLSIEFDMFKNVIVFGFLDLRDAHVCPLAKNLIGFIFSMPPILRKLKKFLLFWNLCKKKLDSYRIEKNEVIL